MRPACFRIHETGTDGSAIGLLGPLQYLRHEIAETFLEYVFFPHLVFGRIFAANFDQPMIQMDYASRPTAKTIAVGSQPTVLEFH